MTRSRLVGWLGVLIGLWSATVVRAVSFYHADIVVYGDSPSAVTAAIELAGSRHDVLLVSPSVHVGGMMVEGLGYQDTDSRSGNGAPIGGLAHEFYMRIAKVYTPSSTTPRYAFEAKVAESVIDAWLSEKGVRQLRGARLSEAPNAIRKQGTRITELTLEDGTRVAGRVFIDGTVEGDLMAFAGVTYTWGREGNAQYGETINGVINPTTVNQYAVNVDPYVTPGVPASGVLTGVQNETVGVNGTGDLASMGYCFRLPLTKNPAAKIPITAPPGYQASAYELYRRYLAAGGMNDWLDGPGPIDSSTTTKAFDLGSWHDLSGNLYGRNHGYPDGTYAQRAQIYSEHKNFTQGLIYYLSTDPGVPATVRNEWSRWGLCADEFTDNGGWPRRLYVRCARRMVSDYVITEADVRATAIGSLVPRAPATDPVGLAYWPPDLHNARTVIRNGKVYNEGATFDQGNYRPFGIAYRALVPRRDECTNLLVPSALSSSYVGYGAVRLEWTFMVLGQAAGIAAACALDQNTDVQDVPYASLRPLLLAGGQVLSLDSVTTGPEVIVDNNDAGAVLEGTWTASTFYSGFYGTNYLHDGNTGKGAKSVRFTPSLPSAGLYRVYARWNSDSTRSAAVPVEISHAGGLAALSVNQQQNPNIWNLLGTWSFNAGTAGSVRIRNSNTTGYVIADAVRFLRVDNLPQVAIAAAAARTGEAAASPGLFKVIRTGDTSASLTINLSVGGTATAGADYVALPSTLTFAAGAASASLEVQAIPDGLIEGTETVVVSVATGGGYTQGAASTATVQVLDKPFDGWRQARFSPAQAADPAVSGATADPDGNGAANLMEFALGAEPGAALATPPCEMNYRFDGMTPVLELIAWRRRDLGGYVLTPQISTDLQSWTTLEDEGVVLDYDAARDRLRMLYTLTVPTSATRFFARLQARPAGPQPVDITVNAANVIRSDITRATFGGGVEFANPQFRTMMQPPATGGRNAVKAFNLGSFRFPNGTPSLYYYWNIPAESYIEAPFVKSDIITVDQAYDFVDPAVSNSLDMEMLFQVNTFQYKAPDLTIKRVSSTSGSNKYVIYQPNLDLAAQSAGDWVYNNLHTQSTSRRVTYWEVGNEDWVYWTAGEYATIFNAFAAKMKTSNPSARLLAQSYTGVISIVGGGTNDRGWTDGLLAGGIAADQVYALSEHQYLPGGVFTTGTYEEQRAQQTLNMSAIVAKGERVEFLKAKLAERGLNWKIWMTEFNASPKGPAGAVIRLQDVGHAQVIADWTGKMLEQGVERLFMHSLDHNPYYTLINYVNDGGSASAPRVTAPGYAFSMFAQEFGPTMVTTGVSDVGLLSSRDQGDFPQVSAYSSIRESDKTLRMFLINRSPDSAVPVRITTQGRTMSGDRKVTRRQLYSQNLSDSNYSVADYVKWSAPVESPGNAEAIDGVVLPAHSVTFLVIPLQ